MNARIISSVLMLASSLALPLSVRADDAGEHAGHSHAAPAATPATPALATVAIGAMAPDFALASTSGEELKLSSFRGKTVVLEWFNPDCPFVVQAHGESGALRTMGNNWSDKGVTWLAINSGAEGKQGAGLDRNAKARTDYKMSYPVLLDPGGVAGRAYGAKTTPHVFVIDPQGKLVYRGAVDNAPMGELKDGDKRIVYLQDAIEAVVAGKPVATAETKSYGCSVKYATK